MEAKLPNKRRSQSEECRAYSRTKTTVQNSVQLCNIHHPDNDCPGAKRPDIRTQTYTYVACSIWGAEIVGSAKLRMKREHENKTGGNWREEDRQRPLFPRSRAYIFGCLTLTRHPYYLRAWNRLTHMVQRRTHPGKIEPLLSQVGGFCFAQGRANNKS